jgi:hypothetical protein
MTADDVSGLENLTVAGMCAYSIFFPSFVDLFGKSKLTQHRFVL